MLVTDIEISQYKYCQASSRHLAVVRMILKNQEVTLFCRIDLPEDENQAKRASAFVTEATRQLFRMPEYRSGQKVLEFADDLDGFAARQTA